MKKIKTLLGLSTAAMLAVATPFMLTTFTVTAPVALTGCMTGPGGGTNNTAQIDATALILQNTARSGALAAITPPTGSTNNIAYFQAASQAIGVFLTGKDYSPVAFQQALIAVKVPGADNLWVQLVIGAVIDLYQVYFSQYVQGQVNGNFAAGTFLLAIQNGFNQALGNPITPLPTNLQLRPGQSLASPVLPRPLKR
jgi:hypothetical protein